jgi:hypothetical protein
LLKIHVENDRPNLCGRETQLFNSSFYKYTPCNKKDLSGVGFIQDLCCKRIFDGPLTIKQICDFVHSGGNQINVGISNIIGGLQGMLKLSTDCISKLPEVKGFLEEASHSNTYAMFCKIRGSKTSKFKNKLIAKFIKLCNDKLVWLNSEFEDYDFAELYNVIYDDYFCSDLVRYDDCDHAKQIAMDALWNGINLFFVNGLLSKYRFPLLEHVDLNVSLNDALDVIAQDIRKRI